MMKPMKYFGRRTDSMSYEIEQNRVVLAFILMQLIGCIGLTLVLATAVFSKHVKRHSTWYSFIGSWIFSCISYCLLFLGGQQIGEPPALYLCTLQGAMIYAAPCLTSCTTLSLVIHTFLNFRSLLYKSNSDGIGLLSEMLLLGVPYLVWLVVFIGTLVFELQNPATIGRSPNGTYCDSTSTILSKISSIVVVVATLSIIVLLTTLGYRIIKNRRVVLKERGTISFATLIRAIVFSVIGTLALGLAVSFIITDNHDNVFDLVLASLPVLAVLTFGSQLDIIRVWACQRGVYEPASASLSEEQRHLRDISLSSGTSTVTNHTFTSSSYHLS